MRAAWIGFYDRRPGAEQQRVLGDGLLLDDRHDVVRRRCREPGGHQRGQIDVVRLRGRCRVRFPSGTTAAAWRRSRSGCRPDAPCATSPADGPPRSPQHSVRTTPRRRDRHAARRRPPPAPRAHFLRRVHRPTARAWRRPATSRAAGRNTLTSTGPSTRMRSAGRYPWHAIRTACSEACSTRYSIQHGRRLRPRQAKPIPCSGTRRPGVWAWSSPWKSTTLRS